MEPKEWEKMKKAHANNIQILRQAEKDGKITDLKILGSLSTKLVMSWREGGKLQEIVV